MNAPELHHDWTEANQRYLVAEFARLKLRLRGDDEAAATTALEQARGTLPAPAAIDRLSDSFGLSAFERDLLLFCAGVEMDTELAALCADARQGRAQASFGLALAALPEPHWSALTPVRPLRRWRLVEVDESTGLTTSRLRIDERVLHYLAGVNYLDPRLRGLLRPVSAGELMAAAHQTVCDRVAQVLHDHSGSLPVVQLCGDDAHGQQDVACRVAGQLGLQVQVLRAEDIPASPHESESLAVLWEREAALLESALYIEFGEAGPTPTALRLAERIGGVVFVGSQQPATLQRATVRFAVNRPDRGEQKRLWEEALGAAATRVNGGLDGVAAQFRLSARSIAEAGQELAPALAAGDHPEGALWHACRGLERTRLEDLAQRIDAAAGWDDLILPEAQRSTLRQIAAHVKHRLKVYEDWGFARKGSRGLGISALFAGESGTGKTMAAEVLANELHLDVYRIDLSSVVSKYIGETEKNLKRVFDAAEDSGAILLFDEADALFGKRSEVKDSHDRYANIEVSYLLQRMESYRGLAILTTNIKTALDTAFQRRLRFVVHFPFPNQEQRELIWRGMFPESTPIEGIDYAKLARLHVAGGNIRNIALNAAFLAAEGGDAVGMVHLLNAAHGEASKRERPLADAETRGWV
ncbi:MAG: ATP-binding protein [Gammaproteobacteria bacterium]